MRGKNTNRKPVERDPKFDNAIIAKLINRSMNDGKKTTARSQIYKALSLIASKSTQDALEVFEGAIKNITPQMEVRSRRIGGAAYQVPVPVKPPRNLALAIRWLVMEANKRSSKEYHSYAEKLAAEILDAYNNQGGAINKKMTSHKMAEANKAFAHFRW